MKKPVVIYTDGSCLRNPGGKGGWAAVFEYRGVRKVLYDSAFSTTNNKMELLGPIEALRHLDRSCKVELYSDSKYVLDGITSWIEGWKKCGWCTKTGKSVKNLDLWQMLDFERERHVVTWHWVRGHSGVELNEIADYYATRAAHEQTQRKLENITGVDFGFLKRKG